MAERVTVILECDGCGTRRHGRSGDPRPSVKPLSVADLRQLLVVVGWRCDAARDSDLCPSCVLFVDVEAGGRLD